MADLAALQKIFPDIAFRPQVPIGKQSWFQTGGNAEILYQPKSIQELQYFLKNKPESIATTFIGGGSNVLIRDAGLPGITIRLRRNFNSISTDDNLIRIGAGTLDSFVAQEAAKAGIAGLEFLIGIPGSIGGNLRMNAGCYGTEIKDTLICCKAISPDGTLHQLSLADMGFSYRNCTIPKDWIFIEATFKGHTDKPENIHQRLQEIQQNRLETQPTGGRTGGSTFRNPPNEKAWKLVEQAGFRGKKLGGAMFSDKHCNFLINTGNATAADIETLGNAAKQTVLEQTGIDLHWEIERLGQHS